MRQFIVYLFSLMVFTACIDRVELPIRNEEPRLVVEGQITNEDPPYRVRLTYTGNNGGTNGQNPADQYVREAQVSLRDDQGRSTGFVSVGQGIYQTRDMTFRGQMGRTYSLSVVLSDGKRYVSNPEKMSEVPAVDSLYAANVSGTTTGLSQYFFRFYVSVNDPANQRNYYRWTAKSYSLLQCGSEYPIYYWVPSQNTAVNIISDGRSNGNTFRQLVIRSPIYSTGPHFVEVKQYAITRDSYAFWNLYQQHSARTGSTFDPLPAPVIGNLANADDQTDKGRGFLDVCAITVKRVRYYPPGEILRLGVRSYLASMYLSGNYCDQPGRTSPLFDPPEF